MSIDPKKQSLKIHIENCRWLCELIFAIIKKCPFFVENDEKMEDMEAEEEEGDHCQCPKSLIALPPLRLSEAVNHSSTASTSHCYKCAGTYFS